MIIRTTRIIRCCCVLLAYLTVAQGGVGGGSENKNDGGNGDDDDVISFSSFLEACTEGNLPVVQAAIAQHPDWVNQRSEHGETCLHVAGILGQAAVTKLILQEGGDPNIRSTYEAGLRMHPLSWNIFHGHAENVQLLLQAGANVNLDFDHMMATATQQPVTVLDVLEEIIQNTAEEQGQATLDKYLQLKKILLEAGAKPYAEVVSSTTTTTQTNNEL